MTINWSEYKVRKSYTVAQARGVTALVTELVSTKTLELVRVTVYSSGKTLIESNESGGWQIKN